MKAGFVLLLGLCVMLPITGHADTTWPAPEIARIEALDVPDTVAYAMRGEVRRFGPVCRSGGCLCCGAEFVQVHGPRIEYGAGSGAALSLR